jgi:hypothetical protein
MRHTITKDRLTAGFIVLVVAAWGVLPFVIFEGPYGEVPIPGETTVHLPAGEVDVTLRTAGPAGGVSVPPLSIRVSGPDGTTQPEVIESARWKSTDSQGNMLVRVWVVRIAQAADYHIEVQGEVYRPYQPPLTFGRPIWNEALEMLVNLGLLLLLLGLWTALVIFVGVWSLVLVCKLHDLCAKHRPWATSERK